MVKKWIQTTATVVIVLSLYSLLALYFDESVVLYAIIGAGLLLIVGFIIFSYTPDTIMDQSCDTDRYLAAIDRKYKDKLKPEYLVRLAYMYTHKGEMENASNILEQVDHSGFDSSSKEFYMFYTSTLRVLYNNKDIEKYEETYSKLKGAEILKKEEIAVEVFEAPLLMMKEEYDDALDILFKWIPVHRKRILILELEYYLELIYFVQDKIEDAKAVAEFMANRNFNNFYTHKFKEWDKQLNIEEDDSSEVEDE